MGERREKVLQSSQLLEPESECTTRMTLEHNRNPPALPYTPLALYFSQTLSSPSGLRAEC